MLSESLRNELRNVKTMDDLHEVYAFLKGVQTRIMTISAQKFMAGDAIEFTYKGKKVQGIVTKVNQKTIKVLSTDKVKWSISPNLLKKL
jgi:hypothetical protein